MLCPVWPHPFFCDSTADVWGIQPSHFIWCHSGTANTSIDINMTFVNTDCFSLSIQQSSCFKILFHSNTKWERERMREIRMKVQTASDEYSWWQGFFHSRRCTGLILSSGSQSSVCSNHVLTGWHKDWECWCHRNEVYSRAFFLCICVLTFAFSRL